MRARLLPAAALLLAACTTPTDPTATVQVAVGDTAGIPVGGLQVQVQQVEGTQVSDLDATTVTAADGTAHLELPVNATVAIGLSRHPDQVAWQHQMTVPVGGASLIYQVASLADCPVIDPGAATPCPTPTPTP